jgi:xanthine dehydrogenase YagR molybdenum-binding subunit
LKVEYIEEPPTASFAVGDEGADPVGQTEKGPTVGDAIGAYAKAPIKIDARYATPTQHHNSMELFTTTCAWKDGKLTVWESSQNVYGYQYGLADQLGIAPADVRIVSPYLGGAFGGRSFLPQTTAVIALGAKMIGRPVKLEATRADGFTIATYRAETRHRVRLAATREGQLRALIHDGWEVSSRRDTYKVAGVGASTRLYACNNVASSVTVCAADRATPGFMRAPAEMPYLFALESAMDELAVALNLDPIELRRINDTQVEPIEGRPYTSRALMQCFDVGAERFGWNRRNPTPGSMRDQDWRIGFGCASSLYPTVMAPAAARITLRADGTAQVQTAAHEMGQGVRTVLAVTAAEGLGIPVDHVRVEVGDSSLPPGPVAGGSNSTASICNVVAKGCQDIRERIIAAAVAAAEGPLKGVSAREIRIIDGYLVCATGREPLRTAIARLGRGALEAYAENSPYGTPADGVAGMYKGQPAFSGGAFLKDRIQCAFGAQFVEVRVHERTGEIRVPRLVGAFAAGRIVNPLTARSQIMGGQIWGMSAALHEATEIDAHHARYVNADLAGYLIPVAADIGQIESLFVPEEDSLVNELGIKGIGELGNVGLNAAIANAVFHATGVRIRELPIRIEHVLAALHAPARGGAGELQPKGLF